jgi:predicted MFS family arabinose efflux permease
MTLDTRRLSVAVAGYGTFINLYPTQAILPQLATTFHVTSAQIGLTITASTIAVAMLAPFVGLISDRLGRKRLIVAAAWTLVLPTVLNATAQSLPQMLAWRFAQGLLLPFIFTVTLAYVGDEAEGAEGIKLVGAYGVGSVLGGFSGRLIAGYVADFFGWRAAFVTLGALTASAAAIVSFLLPPEKRFRPVHGIIRAMSSFSDHLRNRRLLATDAVGFGMLFSNVAAYTFVNLKLAAAPYNLGPAQLGNIFIVYLLGALATIVATRFAVRIGRLPTLLLGIAVAIIGLLLTLLEPLAWIVGGLALLTAGIFTEQTLSLGYIGVAARRARSTAVGLYVTIYYIGGSIGGIAPGGIWQTLGWPGCVALVVMVQILMGIIALLFWRETPPRLGG